ncbi:MAG: polyprenyl synthetase family protein [Candidatus Omnitrophica bacterium]|nr:polyprenyl synthetase family protein [Candidatus Omnitrophota bacterium]
MIANLQRRIEKSIADFTERIYREYQFHLIPPGLYENIREYSLRRGKRIRPILVLLSYQGYNPANRVPSSLYQAATCMEYLHNFMLIHDDIIDNSDLRRGKPTMHKGLSRIIASDNPDELGKSLAIIAGDIIYALAIDAFLSINVDSRRKEKALKYFVQTAAFTAMGEFVDTIHGVAAVDQIREKDVFLNYDLKTARYTFDCPLVIGAILAGAPAVEIKKLSHIGLLIGEAFQIQDDVIGIFDTEENIGKPILSDLAESKKTLLVAHAQAHMTASARKQFNAIFTKPAKTAADLDAIRALFKAAGSLDYCLRLTEDRLVQAKKEILTLRMRPAVKKIILETVGKIFKKSAASAF